MSEIVVRDPNYKKQAIDNEKLLTGIFLGVIVIASILIDIKLLLAIPIIVLPLKWIRISKG